MALAGPVQTEIKSKYPFVSGHSRAQWVTILLLIVILIDVLAVISDFSEIQLLSRVQAGLPISEAEAVANDSRQTMMGFIYFIAYIVTAIIFCFWIHRSHRNLPSLGVRDLKYSPAWAVGGFFVPILSLYRPYQVTKEIWKASDPNAGLDWQGASVSPLIGWWWGIFIISNYIDRLAVKISLSAETISSIMSSSVMTLVTDIVDIPAAILAIMLVQAITQRQEKKSQRIS